MQVASDASPSGRCYQHLAELHSNRGPDSLGVRKLGQLVLPLRAGTRLGGLDQQLAGVGADTLDHTLLAGLDPAATVELQPASEPASEPASQPMPWT